MKTRAPTLSVSAEHLARFWVGPTPKPDDFGIFEKHMRVLDALRDPDGVGELDDENLRVYRKWKERHRTGLREIPLRVLDFEGGGIYRLDYTVHNDALSGVIHHVENIVPRDDFFGLWRAELEATPDHLDEGMCFLEAVYSGAPKPKKKRRRRKPASRR
jgi:hypothetical protein